MKQEEVKKKYDSICNFLSKNRMKDALEALSELVEHTDIAEYRLQLEKKIETYRNILKYTIQGAEDPERQKIYDKLLISILELADVVKQAILVDNAWMSFHNLKKEINEKKRLTKADVKKIIDELVFSHERHELLKRDIDTNEIQLRNSAAEHNKLVASLFNKLWLTDKFSEAEVELCKKISKNKSIPWYDECLLVSGIIINLQRCFDEKKIEILFDFVEHPDEEIWQRALTGLTICLYQYDNRLRYYPKIISKLKLLKDNSEIEKNIETIVIQLIKSKDTEKIARKLNEEILPEMMKLKPKLDDKLNLDGIVADDFSEDKNPEWETVFEDTPDLFNKLEEFSMLQMEGSDVFLSAFANLKHFDFFRDMPNWFLPFYKENNDVLEILHSESDHFNTEHFIDAMFHSSLMCNSDKYSFCLNIKYMPDMQKSMLSELFVAELRSLNEIADEDEILNKSTKNKKIYAQYIQDLYRFYKLYHYKNEFYDIFNTKLDIYNTSIFNQLITDHKKVRNIGEFYFEKNYHQEALDIYKYMENTFADKSEIFQKIAFCNQMLENYEEALDYYHKAELFETNKEWNLKKIAICYRKLKKHRKSLRYSLEVEKLQPENLQIQAFIGHCYLDLKDYKKALKYYLKVEFLSPSNKKVLRPIAWCHFVLGNFKESRNYYNLVINEDPNKYDLMNLGHVEWCLGDKQIAINYYMQSVKKKGNNIDYFMSGFKQDKKILLKHGINKDDIPIVLDYLRFSLENS